jgi:hypothetical protein
LAQKSGVKWEPIGVWWRRDDSWEDKESPEDSEAKQKFPANNHQKHFYEAGNRLRFKETRTILHCWNWCISSQMGAFVSNMSVQLFRYFLVILFFRNFIRFFSKKIKEYLNLVVETSYLVASVSKNLEVSNLLLEYVDCSRDSRNHRKLKTQVKLFSLIF